MSHRETVRARGHENVRATHGSTLEITSDDWLTPAGDCIVAVEADTVPREFDHEYKRACRDASATVRAHIEVAVDGGTLEAVVEGRGDPELTFADDRSAVLRTSDYVDDRTVMVGADAAAADLDRELVTALADGAPATVVFVVEP